MMEIFAKCYIKTTQNDPRHYTAKTVGTTWKSKKIRKTMQQNEIRRQISQKLKKGEIKLLLLVIKNLLEYVLSIKNLTLTYEHTVEMNMDECFQQNVVLC